MTVHGVIVRAPNPAGIWAVRVGNAPDFKFYPLVNDKRLKRYAGREVTWTKGGVVWVVDDTPTGVAFQQVEVNSNGQ